MLVAPILSNPYDVHITSGQPHDSLTSQSLPTQLGSFSTPWDRPPELGGVYTQVVTIHAVGDYTYKVSFQVSDRILTIGALFCCVESIDSSGYHQVLHYFMGDFNSNLGAMKFAQFALEHFIEWENWSVCGAFEPFDWIKGDPISIMTGEEIVTNCY